MEDIESIEKADDWFRFLDDQTQTEEEEPEELQRKRSMTNAEWYLPFPDIVKRKSQRKSDFKSHTINLTKGRKIFSALEHADVKTLSTLLKADYPHVEGNTVLHYAVLSACQFKDTVGDIYKYLDLVMQNEATVNTPNTRGYTAIGLAVHYQQKGCIEHMLKHPSAGRLHLDYYAGDRESTVREIIVETYPELQPLLPEPLTESLDSSERHMKLLAALQQDNYDTFRENLELTNSNPWYDEPYHSTLLEIACQMKNRKEFVKFLLENGANPNTTNRITGMPLLHATARSGNFEVLEMLLNKEGIDVSLKDNEDRTILHWWARVNERKSGDKKSLDNCFQLLMSREFYLKVGINLQERSGKTALYTTVESGFQDRATHLLTWGADVMDFEHGSKLLLSENLSMLEGILDDCVESNNEPETSDNYKLTFRYRLLMNIYAPMAESQHLRDLLRHFVMSTFLSLKWRQIRLVFFLDLALYIIFVSSLTAYILYSDFYDVTNDSSVANKSIATLIYNNTHIRCGINDVNFTPQLNFRREGRRTSDDKVLHSLWYFLMISLALLTTRELFHLLVSQWKYLWSRQNWLKIIVICVTLISCSGVVDNMELELHFSAVAILLGWFELLFMSGRLPQLSEQLEMLRTVTFTFLKFMAGYAILLIAFALSFYILFKGSVEIDGTVMFTNPIVSILKTIVMFAGEFEASTLSFDILPYTSHMIFVLFVFLVTIVLLNLLNGLAVNDTDTIRKKAATLSLVARVNLIHSIEAVLSELPRFLTPSLDATEDTFILYPNRQNSVDVTAAQHILRMITEKKGPHKKRKWNKNQDKWSYFTENFSELQLRHKELEKKMDLQFEETRNIFLQILARLDNPESKRSLDES